MKRAMYALAVSVGLMLTAGVGVASASDLLPQAAPATPAQQNDSDQGQVQVVPIAPQANVQNVNVATFDDVEQGDANNANTGQAVQQENTSELQGQPAHDSSSYSGGQSQAGQENDNDQGQVQVVPIAPQLNVQNVNVATFDDVEQGDANNANTGQAAQQENTSERQATHNGTSGGHSQAGQENDSDQGQVQVVPIAPQANVQNVNILTFDDVQQGDANNANTGQAAQQENTQSASSHGSKSKSGGASHAGAQKNDSDQRQVQIVPIAPQLNVQNVNIATFDDVEQGDANNANTGQAAQQENTRKGSSSGKSGYGRSHGSKCDRCTSKHSGGQRNDSDQRQVQIVPIAPQANVQNVNLFTFGDVEQGDANNANTGQAAQQGNARKGGSSHGKHESKPCGGNCEPGHEPKPCDRKYEPRHEPKPCDRRYESKHEPKPCDRKYEPKHESKPCDRKYEPKHDAKPSHSNDCPAGDKRSGQRNESDQRQVQIVPIAPQLNVQNLNLFTFDDVEQGDANNANTGQAVQQRNSQLTGHGSMGGKRPTVT
jgi:hypothetical protein